jgi:protein ImuB
MWSIDLIRRTQRRPSAAARGRDHFVTQGRGLSSLKSQVSDFKSEISNFKSCPLYILLIATSGNHQTVVRCCERALAAGVTRGMSLAHARALLPLDGVMLEEFNPTRDELRLKTLASWAMRFSPVVAPDPPDGLLIDITGCQRVHRGERRLVNAIANSLEWMGFRARVAAASTFACAWAAARYASPDGRFVIRSGDELVTLRDLPIESLHLEQDTIDALHEVNIARVGELTCLPRHDVAARFGQDLLLRLDQATGEAKEAIEPARPIAQPRVARPFDGPVTQIEGIAITVQELITELCELLCARESGVRRLDMDFERIDAANLRETIMLSRPSRDTKHLWTLLRPRVERINLGFGVEKVVLTATRIGRLPHAQDEHWREDASDDKSAAMQQAAAELIDTLASRLGAERIVRVQPMESHVPERAFRYASTMESERSAICDQRSASVRHIDRPTLLLDKPELIEVMSVTPDGPPQWMKWRGEEFVVVASDGPERIAGEWWRSGVAAGLGEAAPRCETASLCDASARDYFRIQIKSGRWLWVYRVRNHLARGQWFVHGEWA